jgi:hypothetical protein
MGDEDLSVEQGPDLSLEGADFSGLDGGNAYGELGGGPMDDGGVCAVGQAPMTCAASPLPDIVGCIPAELCGPTGKGNGYDDNCNGLIDETCSCLPGEVEKCFKGPPGKAATGACTMGTMTCAGIEFGSWDQKCEGGIFPTAESCDGLDNDCDGCPDDGLCCSGDLVCPANVPDANPYTNVTYTGTNYFKAGVASWSWKVEGGPCDRLFSTTTGSPPKQSFTLTGANTATPTIKFTLSGNYTITMTVVGTDGKTYTCKWVQHVAGPGLRFELCWDHTGTSAQGGADLDLHVHSAKNTSDWFEVKLGPGPKQPNPDDCNFVNCRAEAYASTFPASLRPDWGYANSPLAACSGSPSGALWQSNLNACHNPRLDIDNIAEVGRPENTNVDNPKNGEKFRAMVHYFGQDGARMGSVTPVEEHPIVNVYCGGNLKATYGQAPNTLGPCPGPACFNDGTGYAKGLMWRVADVTVAVDGAGNTTDCAITALKPPGATSGYWVTKDVITY